MIGDFWSELFKSVGQLFRNSDQDIEFDRSDLSTLIGSNPTIASAPSSTALAAPSMAVQAKAQLDNLRQVDPNFSDSDFLIAASKAYCAVLAAEGAMDPDQVSSIVTPAFLTCFRGRIQQWRDGGFSRTVSDVSIDPPTIMKLSVDATQESITVRFTGTARRFTKEDMTNVITEGSTQSDSFAEFATFVRPADTTTPKQVGNGGPTHCASCGAPLESGAVRCAFCGAPLSGTGGTWLLDHISDSAYT